MVHIKKAGIQIITSDRKKLYSLPLIVMVCFSSISLMPMTYGIHRMNLSIDPGQSITEQTKTNTIDTTSSSIIPWWNASWHYRSVYDVTGIGNYSTTVNFTALLSSLNVMNKTFENATITVVRYLSNGTMMIVNKTWFNETQTFNAHTNARGVLAWIVSGPSLYGVYFDVSENRGTRRHTVETVNITQTGSVQASLVSTQGWWSEFGITWKTYYTPNTHLILHINTTSQAKNITARFICDNNVISNQSLSSHNNLAWVSTVINLSTRGNWTVTIFGFDDAGYNATPIITLFYVGTPDLSLTTLSIPDFCYLAHNITVIAYVRTYNTTVQHVNVSLLYDNHTTQSLRDLTFQKDQNSTVQFNWLPLNKGKHTLSVRIDYADSNPNNNKRWKWITVEGIPDLGIGNITVSPTPVNEGNPVTISTRIFNIGDGNATNYEVVLYCEQNVNNQTMYYSNEKNSTTISIKKNENSSVNLTWSRTTYGTNSFHGEWAVGIQILNTTATPDSHDDNNRKALFRVLRVTPAERIPPVITNVNYPKTSEQGNSVLITAQITDQSGVDTVKISIRTPSKTLIKGNMTAIENNRYEYQYMTTFIGRYTFWINATDLSPSHNKTTYTATFEITEDRTPPTIDYNGTIPSVQLKNNSVEIRCIASDLSGIKSVTVTISFPDNRSATYRMTNTSHDTKYTYISTYKLLGKYNYSITVTDNKGNENITAEKSFWITANLNDTDNDGMPDAWEIKYELNPYDPRDASQDADHDGITNLEEYKAGTNPLKKLSSSTEFFTRLKDNWGYLAGSILVFIVIVLLAWYGIRRQKKMRINRKILLFIGIILLGVVVLLLSLWDILYNENWLERIIALYGILVILTVLFLYIATKKKPVKKNIVNDFEKTLKGPLYHFKCPSCGGIFAVKKSKQNNKKPFMLTCPDCGITGVVPSQPSHVVEKIPEKKSMNKNFRCEHCGEWITIWAEGTTLVDNLHVYTCPYCGTKQDLRQT